jgi:hypothetical protein
LRRFHWTLAREPPCNSNPITVFAAAVDAEMARLDPAEHDEYRWCGYDEALQYVTYRGLKDGIASTREYITGRESPPRELRLR